MTNRNIRRQRILIPEVIQTSAMDCGPACLKSALEGFGTSVSYGRLREACQTEVDGTSIDSLEELALQLGLDAEQVVVPVDHVLLPGAEAIPAIAVLLLPGGFTHFVVLWRRFGPLAQVMDPASGRRWVTRGRLARDLYVHEMNVSAQSWREWAETEEFLDPLRCRLRRLGIRNPGKALENAFSDPTWRGLGTIDAATRMVSAMIEAGAVDRGKTAERFVHALANESLSASEWKTDPIPDSYRSVLPAPRGPDGEEQVRIRGAVLVRIKGYRGIDLKAEEAASQPAQASAGLSPELAAALGEPPSRPGCELLKVLRLQGLPILSALTGALALAAAGIAIEVLLFRGLIGIGRDLGLFRQRLIAMIALFLFMGALLFLEFPIAMGTQRLGRRLEVLLRRAFLAKIPRLKVRYFQSRPISDMAERSHTMHNLRLLAPRGAQVLRFIFELVLTTAGLIWLSPPGAPIALALAAAVVAVPLLMQKPLIDRDLRLRTHTGALGRFYLDALLGAIPIRTHGIERAMRQEHESLLLEWVRAGLSSQRAAAVFEGIQALLALGLSCLLVIDYLGRFRDPAGALLFVYWTLTLPILGQEIAVAAREYPMYRNLTLRLLEPLGALEEESEVEPAASGESPPSTDGGTAIAFEGVSVLAGGHTILHEFDLEIEPGSHVAIVGRSGAGKSTLIGLLLGWHRPSAGKILVDGRLLTGPRITGLRQETVWVDPSVRIWNRPLIENLHYGNTRKASVSPGEVIETAELREMLQSLPSGMRTLLGEGGGLVSGGEGQRVRFGRALHNPEARLVLLDEPFRGLGREDRKALLSRARTWFPKATLLCVTQDISDSLEFDRVVVVHSGRIVENGRPGELSNNPASRYATLLGAEKENEHLWAELFWKRLSLDRGRLENR